MLIGVAYQLHDLVMNGITPIIEVIIENCWHPWMCEYICIALEGTMLPEIKLEQKTENNR